jgi:predicted dehydrogenase
MLKGAIVGFGRVVEAAHVPAFRNLSGRFRIAAVADERADRLAKAAEFFPGVRTYRKAEELLARETELDFIDVATPPAAHAQLALAVMKAGRHALVEKPLSLELCDAARLSDAAEETGKVLYTVHNWAFAPLYAKLGELVASGALGEIRHAELHTLRTRPAGAESDWRSNPASGGLLVDHGWHALYLLQRFLVKEPSVAAYREKGDESTIFLEAENATGVVHLSWSSAFRSNSGVVYGTKGAALISDDRLVVTTSAGSQTHEFPQKISAGSAHPDWFEAMLPDFENEVRDETVRGRNMKEAACCLRLIAEANAFRVRPELVEGCIKETK